MIQFNLLPDVKLNYIKAQRVKGLVLTISLIVTAVSVGLMAIAAATVYGVQKHTLNSTDATIKKESDELKNTKDIDKILTIQNQLNTIAGLHDKKPVASRLFGYLGQLTPSSAQISDITIDFAANTMTINGSADSYQVINTFADALKYATFSVEGQKDSTKAFSSIVTTFSGGGSGRPGYGLTFTFDPMLFNITEKVALSVPNEYTTRSITEKPATLFDINTDTTQTKTTGGQ